MIILFWSNPPKGSIGDWKNSEAVFTAHHALPFLSHKRVGHKVVLLSYQKIRYVPEHIEVVDADTVIPIGIAYKAIKNGYNIAHVSDLLRFVYWFNNSGIITDCDVVALKKFPKFPFYSSYPAKKSGGVAPKWGKNNPPLYVKGGKWDGKANMGFPMRPSREMTKEMSKYINKIIYKFDRPSNKLLGKAKRDENWIMDIAKELNRKDLNADTFEPLYFCPYPYWSKEKCSTLVNREGQELFGYRLPTHEEILKNSYGVSHWFESAFIENETTVGHWEKVPSDSLVAKEAELICGKDWRSILHIESLKLI